MALLGALIGAFGAHFLGLTTSVPASEGLNEMYWTVEKIEKNIY